MKRTQTSPSTLALNSKLTSTPEDFSLLTLLTTLRGCEVGVKLGECGWMVGWSGDGWNVDGWVEYELVECGKVVV